MNQQRKLEGKQIIPHFVILLMGYNSKNNQNQ